MEELLCSGCAQRPGGLHGLCRACRDRRNGERAAERDLPLIEARRAEWRRRTAAMRTRRRLERRDLAPAWSDPQAIANEALNKLSQIALSPRARIVAAELRELIRMLANGPE